MDARVSSSLLLRAAGVGTIIVVVVVVVVVGVPDRSFLLSSKIHYYTITQSQAIFFYFRNLLTLRSTFHLITLSTSFQSS